MMDYDKKIDGIESFLRKKLDQADADGFVLGLSGGIDSSLTAKLVVECLGPEKLTGLVMPGEPSREENMSDARELADDLGIESQTVDIEPFVDRFCSSADFNPDKVAEGNIRARARMVRTYMEANQRNLLVLGSGNKSERLLGYYTKYGDAAVDLTVLGDLYKTEVRDLARHIGLDSKFIEKEPSAGLWDGQTDEEEIGHPYEKADAILEKLVEEEMKPEEVVKRTGFSRKEVERIDELHRKSEHKRLMPPFPELR